MTAEDWDCEAYGPDGREFGALCFRSAERRICTGPAECSTFLHGERRRVFGRIQELAAAGDEAAVAMAEEITSPDQLMGGPLDKEDER